jgi:hypothetical protein
LEGLGEIIDDFFNSIGQYRSFDDIRCTTALTLEADLAGSRRDVSEVPLSDMARLLPL